MKVSRQVISSGSRYRRTSIESKQEFVAYVTQILDADLAGEKAVDSHLAENSKEFYALTYAWLFISVLVIRNEIENLLLLFRSAVEIGLVISVYAG